VKTTKFEGTKLSTNDWTKVIRDAGRRAGRGADEVTGRHRPGPGRFLAVGALGAAIGAVAAFLFDPQRGRARRAQLLDRGAAWARDAGRELDRSARELSSTVEGKVAALRAGENQARMPNDASLAMKVESELFRDTEVPKGDVNVNVEQGVVVLRGEVADAAASERLEKAARAIPGVWEVENLLHLPGEPAPTHR
jgi:gas vesicle protein